MKNYISGRERPAGGAELRRWLFMRYSGILLIFLAIGHLWIMHIQNNVATLDYSFVAWRLSFWFWKFYDGLLLTLALFHGVAGVVTILEDVIPGERIRQSVITIFRASSAVLWVTGVIILILFKGTM